MVLSLLGYGAGPCGAFLGYLSLMRKNSAEESVVIEIIV